VDKLTWWRQRIRSYVGIATHGLIQSATTFLPLPIHIEIRALKTHYQGLEIKGNLQVSALQTSKS